MVIEESDFRLTPVSNNSLLFDLELLYTVNKGKKSERSEFRVAGYGVTLNNALKSIVQNRLSNRLDVVDLKMYLKEFKDELAKLKELLPV